MARTRREVNAHQALHIVIKAIPELRLFRNDTDRFVYMGRFRRIAAELKVSIRDFSLLSTHAHFLLVPMDEKSLAQLMRRMQTWWAAYVNRIQESGRKRGRVFQDRYHSTPIRTVAQYLATSRYIQRNAVGVMPGIRCAEEYFFCSTRERLSVFPMFKVGREADDLDHARYTGDRLREYLEAPQDHPVTYVPLRFQ